MSENRIRSFKNKGKDSSVSLCPELYVKHCLVESCEKCAHSSNTALNLTMNLKLIAHWIVMF